ncbi:MAG: DNA mismatch repair endonuclease MutL [Candidatus Neomarinimicrobiota bacterium]
MIRSLSSELRNKISAGEVIERPASAVKELVENSLDATATSIQVVIEQGGQLLIQVADNGTGIPADELPAAFERFSTSKISTFNDLSKIKTLGFRGEALASIASVSEVEMESSTGAGNGAKLSVAAGQLSELSPAPDVKGTTVTIRNLFYNTPVRRKFLKSTRVETRHVMQIMRGFALAHPTKNFTLISDGKEIFNLQEEPLPERVSAVYDPTYKGNLLNVDISKGDYFISGYVGNLNLVRSRPGEQYLFLNGRLIKDRLLNSAVYSGFRSLVKRGEYPFFVLNLEIPPDQVDVNVHPMKTEVRFKGEWRIYHVLKSGIEDALVDILKVVPDFEQRSDTIQPGRETQIPFYSGSTSPGSNQGLSTDSKIDKRGPRTRVNVETAKNYASQLASNQDVQSKGLDSQRIWQVHSKYILTEIESGLIIVDQHVAHERILFEEAMDAFDSHPMPSQTLLFPETVEFSPDDFAVLLDLFPYLEKIGFRIRKDGKNQLFIDAIPSAMTWGNEKLVLTNIIDHYISHQKKYSSFQENLAASFACHAAIKAGDELTKDEMNELVNRLFGTKHPYYCPHGRPIIVQLSLDELDHRFER